MHTAVQLVTAILTVVKTIAPVALRDTVLVCTCKLILFTCCKNQHIHQTQPKSSNNMNNCTTVQHNMHWNKKACSFLICCAHIFLIINITASLWQLTTKIDQKATWRQWLLKVYYPYYCIIDCHLQTTCPEIVGALTSQQYHTGLYGLLQSYVYFVFTTVCCESN